MSRKVLYREYDNEGNLIKLECYKCGEIKTIDNFCKDKYAKDGYKSQCRECVKKYDKQYNPIYQTNNRDKILKKKQEYAKKNREKILEYHRQYYKENKEKITDYMVKYRANNKEILKERNKQQYYKNIDKRQEYSKQYKAKYKEKIQERSKHYYTKNKKNICEYKKHYYTNNKEKIQERNKQYYINNKEDLIKYRQEYYKNNKEIIIEKTRLYQLNNKDKERERRHKHYEENKEKELEKAHKRYENKIQEEIIKIYENVTKQLYPHNGIQYGVIYGVHCKVTDRWYIGQTTTSFNIRYNTDFFSYKTIELSKDSIKGKLLQDDIEKYSEENFEIFEVLDVAFSEKELDEKEVYYIDYYKAYDEGYNSNRGNIFKHNKSKRKEVI